MMVGNGLKNLIKKKAKSCLNCEYGICPIEFREITYVRCVDVTKSPEERSYKRLRYGLKCWRGK